MPRWKAPTKKQRSNALKTSFREADESLPPWCRPDVCRDAFSRCPRPGASDWLAEHAESGQTFRAFTRLSMKAVPHAHVRVIELVPLGRFFGGVSPSLEQLRQFVGAFFVLPVRVAPGVPLRAVCANAREGAEGQVQILTTDVYDFLQAGAGCWSASVLRVSGSLPWSVCGGWTRSLSSPRRPCRASRPTVQGSVTGRGAGRARSSSRGRRRGGRSRRTCCARWV